MGKSWCGKSMALPANFPLGFDPDHDEAWFLISDLPASPRLVSTYALRMRVEAT